MKNDKELMNRAADNIRILAASMVEKANSGHPGGAMGGADFVNVLFSCILIMTRRCFIFSILIITHVLYILAIHFYKSCHVFPDIYFYLL